MDPSQRMKPMIPAPICNGRAHRISFFTPEREVYVEAPVKFIAKKAESAGMSRSQASISKRPANVIPSFHRTIIKRKAVNNPTETPLIEKDRPGSQGSKVGVKTAPARMAVRMARAEKRH